MAMVAMVVMVVAMAVVGHAAGIEPKRKSSVLVSNRAIAIAMAMAMAMAIAMAMAMAKP
jgi:multisubunit Na+/H+ antiporter MnhB subunit